MSAAGFVGQNGFNVKGRMQREAEVVDVMDILDEVKGCFVKPADSCRN